MAVEGATTTDSEPRWKAIVLTLAFLALLVVDLQTYLALSVRPTSVLVTIESDTIAPERERAYVTSLDAPDSPSPLLFADAASDDPVNPNRSAIRVYEDGVLLGPAHASHHAVRTEGGGRYSHWKGQLYLSARDDTSPRDNGRRYTVEVPLRVNTMFVIPQALAHVVFFIVAIRQPRGRARAFIIYVTLVLAGCVLANATDRSVLGAIEAALPPIIFTTALLGAAFAWLARMHPELRRRSRRIDRTTRTFCTQWGAGLAGIVGIITLSTVLVGEITPVSDLHSYQASLFGRVPTADARGYVYGAEHVLREGQLDPWNHRRPINASFLAFRTVISGHQMPLIIASQILLVMFALYYVSCAFGRRYGVWAGLALFALMVPPVQFKGCVLLSEMLGLTFASLGFGLILDSIHRRSRHHGALGVSALCWGMLARAGALFVLPAVVLALVVINRWKTQRLLRPVAFLVVGSVIGVGLNGGLLALYGTGEGVTNANFSYVALGLAQNVTWERADDAFQDDLRRLDLAEQVDFRYRKAWELIREDPRPFTAAATSALQGFTSSYPHVVAKSVFPMGERVGFGSHETWYGTALWIVLVIFALVALVRHDRAVTVLWMAASLGIFASIPFIYGAGSWKVLASSYPAIMAFPALACASPRRSRERIRPVPSQSIDAATVTGLIAFAALLGPRLLHQPPPTAWTAPIEANQSVIHRSAFGGAVACAPRDTLLPVRMHRLDPPQCRALLALTPNRDSDVLRGMDDPYVVFWAHDLGPHQRIATLYIAPPETLHHIGTSEYILVTYERTGDQYHMVTAMQPISPTP